jgi:hypothetical protein
MFSMENNHYIADGDNLYRITVDSKEGRLTLNLNKVIGYKPLR